MASSLILFLHSQWAYVVFLTLVIAFGNALYKKIKKKPFTSKDFRISLFALISIHIQLLLGILRYLTSPSLFLWEQYGHRFMANHGLRLRFVEHPIASILAVTLITIGWSIHKKQTLPSAKFSKIIVFYGFALLLIILRLPLFWD